jgi:ammonium transporter, Amt family
VCAWACIGLKPRLGYDDSLDVFGVHGVGGLLGTLLAGVLAVGAVSASPETPGGSPGLIDGNPGQVLVQLAGIGASALWCAVATFTILKVVNALAPLRVSQESEIMGLDIALHGEAVQ